MFEGLKTTRRDILKATAAGATYLGMVGVGGGQSDGQTFERYCAFRGPTDGRSLLEPDGCAYVYLDDGTNTTYISPQSDAGWSVYGGAGALTWDAADLDNGTDTGVVHEDTANTDYNNDALIRKGDPTASPLYASDLVLWCPLQESSGGTAYDFSGNNRDGTVQGATQAGGTNLTGLPTYSFDNSDDYVQFSDLDAFQTFPLTTMCWVKTSSNPSTEAIVSKFATSDSPGMDIAIVNGNLVINAVNPANDTGDTSQNTSTSNYSTNEWIHVAGVWSGDSNDDIKLYVDGTLEDSTTPSSVNPDARNPLWFGSWPVGGRYYGGDLADVRLYNREMAQSEIQEVYDVFGAPSDHETVYKGPSPSSSPTALFTSVSIPSGTSATLEFLEDTDGDGTADNTDSVAMSDGKTDYTASGLAGSGDLALRVTLKNTDLTVGSTVEVPVGVTE